MVVETDGLFPSTLRFSEEAARQWIAAQIMQWNVCPWKSAIASWSISHLPGWERGVSPRRCRKCTTYTIQWKEVVRRLGSVVVMCILEWRALEVKTRIESISACRKCASAEARCSIHKVDDKEVHAHLVALTSSVLIACSEINALASYQQNLWIPGQICTNTENMGPPNT